MAAEEIQVVELRDDFYRDSLGRVVFIIIGFCIAIMGLLGLSLFFYLDKPPPVTFPVDNEMRVQPPVPLTQPYLSTPDLLQWVADVLQKVFVFDFNHYNQQLKDASQYFTTNGWQAFLNQLNIYANYNNVQAYKLFITSTPEAAPYVLREGVIQESGRYGWWVQMPVTINYAGYKPPPSKPLVLQLLVVRVSTLNNLTGVGIDNVIQAPAAEKQA
ncbi:MAG: DotI/IcmL/TraM family protein [Gammaproteobacteria bacterium]|nr:DotI/IcmL/TraM family protein [Gammaproteobacteria bacterium]MCW5582569.1 DotI/IcmL/TraM family protein [Gammaproteobacteria bacterium]